MRTILTLTLSFLGLHFAAAQVVHLYDSLYTESWNTATSAWKPSEKQIYFTRPDCKDYDSIERFAWNTGTSDWKYSYSYHSYFDANGLSTTYEGINQGTGNPFYKYIYSYSGGKISEYVLQYWQTHLSAYRNDTRLVYYRKPVTLTVDSYYVQRWDTVANIWKPSEKLIYLYNSSNINIGYIDYVYRGGIYVNYIKADYTKTATNKMNTTLSSKWDTITSTWIATSRTSYTYNANDFNTQSITEQWKVASSAWVNYARTTNNPTVYNEIANSLTEGWDVASSAWKNNSRSYYWYGCVYSTEIVPIDNHNSTIHIYPNPTSSQLTIENTQNRFSSIQIIDVMGRTIRTEPLRDGIQSIDVQSLIAAPYFVRFTGESGFVVKRFVKE